jgi:hypothetical protein
MLNIAPGVGSWVDIAAVDLGRDFDLGEFFLRPQLYLPLRGKSFAFNRCSS